MSFAETLRLALQALRANKLRSALTLVGMAIGVFSVIASVTAVGVLDGTFKDNLVGLGTNTITVEREWDPMTGQMKGQPLPYAQAERLDDLLTLAASVSPKLWQGGATVRAGGESTEPSVGLMGTTGDYLENNGKSLARGRFLTDDDVRSARSVAVLGATLVGTLFEGVEAVGKEVRIDGRRYTVVGVAGEEAEGLGGGSANNRVYVPITRLIAAYGLDEADVDIDVRARSAEAVPGLRAETIGQMRAIRRLPPEAENDFEVTSNEATAETFDGFASALTAGGVGIGLIALLAAGVGVMNIMLVSVTERTREIGVRKSLGATRRDIGRQFLVEAVVLCQIGGLTGVALGVLGGNVAAAVLDSSPAFPWAWALGALAGVTAVALAFGVYPATKAARLHPIEALRQE
ncbi:ABC transporter permease [Rubrivirga sp. S365]|uniref:ABC transporter permease n=1 Tax=Rubrivirga litoralis TaxID=3075598 RepID=A0ABU3BS91_9BACT|nr:MULTISPECIES: ABC transporter permease [unclassified Rubrivirga]MDT0632148.1 ABC transporter permease [Rubrivirga sp. F394]MDT7857040.1 ABC transporter permease [Rubrivirga sp. S365]